MPYEPPPHLAGLSLTEIARLAAARKLPPVEQWSPEAESDSFMRIASDGRWFHKGEEIRRQAMIALFSGILRREGDGRFALVTPYEKQFIEVEDAPFVAQEVTSHGSGRERTLSFRTNAGDLVLAGPEHPIRVEGTDEEPRPYLNVRRGLDARLHRSVFYELAEMAFEECGDDAVEPGLCSEGSFFSLRAKVAG